MYAHMHTHTHAQTYVHTNTVQIQGPETEAAEKGRLYHVEVGQQPSRSEDTTEVPHPTPRRLHQV